MGNCTEKKAEKGMRFRKVVGMRKCCLQIMRPCTLGFWRIVCTQTPSSTRIDSIWSFLFLDFTKFTVNISILILCEYEYETATSFAGSPQYLHSKIHHWIQSLLFLFYFEKKRNCILQPNRQGGIKQILIQKNNLHPSIRY